MHGTCRLRYHLPEGIPVILGGYSLAAFFSLWCAWQTPIFSAIAAASPSVWFPHWLDYAKRRPPQTQAIYLSLGDKEERTRNPVMASVGNCIRQQYAYLAELPRMQVLLEWNRGNHFQQTEQRCAKAFAWCVLSWVPGPGGASSTRG